VPLEQTVLAIKLACTPTSEICSELTSKCKKTVVEERDFVVMLEALALALVQMWPNRRVFGCTDSSTTQW